MAPTKAPSIMSVSSVKKFAKKIFRPKDKPTGTGQIGEIPEGKKRDDRKKDEVKDEVHAHESIEREEPNLIESKTQSDAEKVEKTIAKKTHVDKITTSKVEATKTTEAIDEEQEQELEVKGNYAVILNAHQTESWRMLKYMNRSFYTPNSVSIFNKLKASFRILGGNDRFLNRNNNFYSGLVMLGYGVSYYIRLLHVRHLLGENNDNEDRFYRGFIRQIKLSEIPVVGFLEADYANLGYYEAKDSRLGGYLVPQLEPMFEFRQNGSRKEDRYVYRLNDGNRLIQPNIPFMYEWVRTFCDAEILIDDHRIFRNTFVPRRQAAGAPFTVGGFEFSGLAVNRSTATELRTLACPGFDEPLMESQERCTYIKSQLENIGFTDSGPAYLAANANNFNNIEGFMRMNNAQSGWFRTCIDAMSVHASYFNGATNLDAIPARGSREIPISTHVRVNTNDRGVVDIDAPAGRTLWFPNIMRHFNGEFTCYETGYEGRHLWQAMNSPNNAQFSIHYTRSTDAQNDDSIEVFQPTNGAQANAINTATTLFPAQYGPYFARSANGAYLAHRILGARFSTPQDVHIFDRSHNIVRQFYVQDGKSYAWI